MYLNVSIYVKFFKNFTKIGIMKRSTSNYRLKLRSNSVNDEVMNKSNISKKVQTPCIRENKKNILDQFKAPKRKHLTIEYDASKVSQMQKTTAKKLIEPNINVNSDCSTTENEASVISDIKIKEEPIEDNESNGNSILGNDIHNNKQEMKEETVYNMKHEIKTEQNEIPNIKREIKEENLNINTIKTEPIDIYNIKQEIKEEIEECLNTNYKPPFWQEVLNNIREMRKNHVAPVDTMGCDQCPDENASEETFRYHVLISLMLSPQTKDEVTFSAMARLKSHGLTVENILQTNEDKLGQLIYPVGFWKTKAKSIKKTTEILKNEYNGDIPNTLKDLLKLPGVGPKIAHLCMNSAWNVVTGIGVDTHVHRISNRLAWVNPQTKSPEDTRKALEKWLPKDLWNEVNHLMVGFGQTVCRPVGPQCSNCLNVDICPYAKINMGVKKNKKLKKMK